MSAQEPEICSANGVKKRTPSPFVTSQTRSTRHPCARRARTTRRSRRLFPCSLALQKSLLFTGRFECCGQQCQKHPSTKIASLSLRKTKSGLPNTAQYPLRCTLRKK